MSELVSVVVPIYKVEKYLNRCINSIVSQTYCNLEIILVDDGSPDNCPSICDEWAKKDSRIVVVHKQNEGLGKARNTGIDCAKGSYICFFDSDDYIESDTIETCVNAAKENAADLVVFGHDSVTPDMQLLAAYPPTPPKMVFSGEEVKNSLLPMSLYCNLKTGEDWNMVLSDWNKLYSMDVIRKFGWRFASERDIISEDFYSLTELYGHLNCVCVVERVFYHYTVNKTSLSRSYRADRFDKIKFFYQEMCLLAKKMGIGSLMEQPLKGVSFGFVIDAMKLIVASEITFKQKYLELRKIVKSDFSQRMVRDSDFSGVGLQKKLLYGAVKYHLVLLCLLFVSLKNKCNT